MQANVGSIDRVIRIILVERRRRGKAQLSTSEANLLKVFVNNPNRMLQREQSSARY